MQERSERRLCAGGRLVLVPWERLVSPMETLATTREAEVMFMLAPLF
jgi:hypothetical protein